MRFIHCFGRCRSTVVSPVICSVPQNCTDPMRPKGLLLFIAMSSQNKSKSLLQIYVVFGEQPTRAVRLGDKRSNRRDGRVRFARSRGERTNGSTLLREVHSRTCNSRQEVSFLVTARKLSLQRLCFHRCLSVHMGGDLCPGGRGSLTGRPPYDYVRAVRILLECILVDWFVFSGLS